MVSFDPEVGLGRGPVGCGLGGFGPDFFSTVGGPIGRGPLFLDSPNSGLRPRPRWGPKPAWVHPLRPFCSGGAAGVLRRRGAFPEVSDRRRGAAAGAAPVLVGRGNRATARGFFTTAIYGGMGGESEVLVAGFHGVADDLRRGDARTQIMGFTNSSFIGNNLCGPPLTSNCGNDGVTPAVPSHTDDHGEEGDISENEWFYIFISLGYATGFSAFLTTWILKKSWRDACYEWLESMWDMVYVYFYVNWRRLTKPSAPPSS
ncbi:hypothetical protein CASFOL_035238 [Castilleja foliolosa]|uniref:Uncharacterized protein n=1 Tax=Castilleja foliolosa TaxID=1961234 RepID=A0ABD3BT91_9LAMI